jgi:TIR domain
MRYNAFLSYSHAADGMLAPAIQSALHRLARPWYKLRSLWIFRDKTSLSATPALWPTIIRALSDSEYFLLMASPDAAASPWVQQEVEWWLANRTPETLLICMTDGKVQWDPRANDFSWEATNSLPRCLEKKFPQEPLWVDLRWARAEEKLSLRNSEYRSAILDLAATLLQRPKDLIDGDDIRVYRRNRRAAFIAVLVSLTLAIAATTGGAIALYQKDLAKREARLANAERLAAQSQTLMASNRSPQTALLLAAESLKITEDAREPRTPAAEETVRAALANTAGLGLGPIDEPKVASVGIKPIGEPGLPARAKGPDVALRFGDETFEPDFPAPVKDDQVSEPKSAFVGISPDGKWLVTKSDKETLRIRNLSLGR